MNAMRLAIKTETDAIAFYTAAAQKTTDPVGKGMFLSLIQEEQSRLEDFKRIIEELHLKVRTAFNAGKKRTTVFEANRRGMLEKIMAATDEMEALKLAMQMEKESIEFYERLGLTAKSRKDKSLFERLLREERQRYAIFSDTYFFLANSESWFMWEEHSIADGGTPWA